MQPAFLPTPEQIRAECEAIRAEWSPEEWAKRESERYVAARIPYVRTCRLPPEVEHCVPDPDFDRSRARCLPTE